MWRVLVVSKPVDPDPDVDLVAYDEVSGVDRQIRDVVHGEAVQALNNRVGSLERDSVDAGAAARVCPDNQGHALSGMQPTDRRKVYAQLGQCRWVAGRSQPVHPILRAAGRVADRCLKASSINGNLDRLTAARRSSFSDREGLA